MKICAIICEYNPFHNGHLYQLREAKARSKADALLCLMSGNFVQRGEAAVMDKYTRAKHAVAAGADIVLELPTPFATANAELFAKGAIAALSAIPAVSTLCFGAETADKTSFYEAAMQLNDEPQAVSDDIRRLTGDGLSYAKARAEAWKNRIPEEMLRAPNTILGLEYTRAILAKNANIDILPIERRGCAHDAATPNGEFASASALRAALSEKKPICGLLPEYVRAALPETLESRLDTLEKYAILSRPLSELAGVCDCTEGLENAFLRAAMLDAPLEKTLTSSRYTASRIRRIALQHLLKIQKSAIERFLQTPLYLRVLAAKKDRRDLLSELSQSPFPLVIRARDEAKLSETATECLHVDRFAEQIYALLYPTKKSKQIFGEV